VERHGEDTRGEVLNDPATEPLEVKTTPPSSAGVEMWRGLQPAVENEGVARWTFSTAG
jgi:hypothetical protein